MTDGELEVSFHELVPFSTSSQLDVLFDMEEAVLSGSAKETVRRNTLRPTALNRFTNVIDSELRNLTTAALREVEKGNVAGEKERGPGSKQPAADGALDIPLATPASVCKRAKGAAIDAACAITICAAVSRFSFLTTFTLSNTFRAMFLMLALTFASHLLLSIISLLFMGRTPGQHFCKLMVTDRIGGSLGASDLILRTLAQSGTCLLLPFQLLLLCTGKPLLHDKVTGSTVISPDMVVDEAKTLS